MFCKLHVHFKYNIHVMYVDIHYISITSCTKKKKNEKGPVSIRWFLIDF